MARPDSQFQQRHCWRALGSRAKGQCGPLERPRSEPTPTCGLPPSPKKARWVGTDQGSSALLSFSLSSRVCRESAESASAPLPRGRAAAADSGRRRELRPPGSESCDTERERENERKRGSIERERESASFCVFVFQRRRLSDLGPRPRRGPRRDFIPSLTFKKPLRFPRFPQHCWQVARTMRKAVEDCNCESTCAQSSTVESGVSRASTRLRQASQRALSHRCTRRCGPRKKILKF